MGEYLTVSCLYMTKSKFANYHPVSKNTFIIMIIMTIGSWLRPCTRCFARKSTAQHQPRSGGSIVAGYARDIRRQSTHNDVHEHLFFFFSNYIQVFAYRHTSLKAVFRNDNGDN